jgi:hypothetical protein
MTGMPSLCEFVPDTSDVERLLRQEWWMNHACRVGSAYGDDGEMSCCGCGLDFKRMELPALYSHVVRARQMAGAKAWEALRGE